MSNVRKALLDREWVEIRDDGLVLVQPDALLKSWRENYRQPAGHHISGYTVLHGDQLRNRLSGNLNPGPQPPRAICASNSAAEWIAPYVRGGTQSFYADELGARILQEALQLTHAAQGANVILRIPTTRPCSKTPSSRHPASSAPIRSSPTSICGTATIGTARPPTIWP